MLCFIVCHLRLSYVLLHKVYRNLEYPTDSSLLFFFEHGNLLLKRNIKKDFGLPGILNYQNKLNKLIYSCSQLIK